VPLAYRIDPAARIVTITGDYSEAAEWRRLLTAIMDDGNFGAGFSFIRDLRASEHPVSAETVIAIIAVVQEFWDRLGAHRAAIVTRPGIDNPAMVAHALADHEHIPLRAFTSYEDAVAWLHAEPG
jgi:hypothetical protein